MPTDSGEPVRCACPTSASRFLSDAETGLHTLIGGLALVLPIIPDFLLIVPSPEFQGVALHAHEVRLNALRAWAGPSPPSTPQERSSTKRV